jgi:hypothetical protein
MALQTFGAGASAAPLSLNPAIDNPVIDTPAAGMACSRDGTPARHGGR